MNANNEKLQESLLPADHESVREAPDTESSISPQTQTHYVPPISPTTQSDTSAKNFASINNPEATEDAIEASVFANVCATIKAMLSMPVDFVDNSNQLLVDMLHQNKEILIPTIISAAGDLPWAYFSYRGWNVAFNAAPAATFENFFNPEGQVAAQMTYTVISMITMALFLKSLYCAAGRASDFPTAMVLSTITSTGIAIPAWETGGILGANTFTSHPGYLSGFFSGPAEGLTLMLVNTGLMLLLSEEQWASFTQNKVEYIKNKLAELRLSVTAGAIPGTVWQIVYNVGATTEALLGFPAMMSSLVALTVAICNGLYSKCLPAMIQGLRKVDAGIADVVASMAESVGQTAQKAGQSVAGFFSDTKDSSSKLPDPFQFTV